ncbi:hypothetical protein KA037_06140, partial [Patescibacteria group bacterium]|nr:hypothetical protein [Patescibacteria group bacterium]
LHNKNYIIMPHPLNHLRKRKNPVTKKNTSRAHQILDKIIYVVAIGGPFLTLPQIKAIWVDNMIQ